MQGDGEWRAVTRYDTSHGEAHQDTQDRRGRQVGKRWLGDVDLKRALAEAEADLRANWRLYVARFARDER